MTRKDYKALADTLRLVKPPTNIARGIQWERDCLAISRALQADSDRFDRAKFLQECGLGHE